MDGSSRRGHRVTGTRLNKRNTYTPDGRRIGDAGWEYVHIAIDDATRLAYDEGLGDEKALTAVGFLGRAVQHYASYGITAERLITDG